MLGCYHTSDTFKIANAKGSIVKNGRGFSFVEFSSPQNFLWARPLKIFNAQPAFFLLLLRGIFKSSMAGFD